MTSIAATSSASSHAQQSHCPICKATLGAIIPSVCKICDARVHSHCSRRIALPSGAQLTVCSTCATSNFRTNPVVSTSGLASSQVQSASATTQISSHSRTLVPLLPKLPAGALYRSPAASMTVIPTTPAFKSKTQGTLSATKDHLVQPSTLPVKYRAIPDATSPLPAQDEADHSTKRRRIAGDAPDEQVSNHPRLQLPMPATTTLPPCPSPQAVPSHTTATTTAPSTSVAPSSTSTAPSTSAALSAAAPSAAALSAAALSSSAAPLYKTHGRAFTALQSALTLEKAKGARYKPPRATSQVWSFFDLLDFDWQDLPQELQDRQHPGRGPRDVVTIAVCNVQNCGSRLYYVGGTSNLLGHLQNVHAMDVKPAVHQVAQAAAQRQQTPTGGDAAGSQIWPMDHPQQIKADHAWTLCLATLNIPPSILRSPACQNALKATNPSYTPLSVSAFKTLHLPREVEDSRERLRAAIQAGRTFAVSCDFWRQVDSAFVTVLLSSMTEDFRLQSTYLCTRQLPWPHTASAAKYLVERVLTEYNLSLSVLASITTDNSKALVSFSQDCGAQSLACFCNTLQLCVRKGLATEAIQALLLKFRLIVVLLRRFANVKEALVEDHKPHEDVGVHPAEVGRDSSVYWNSEFLMIEQVMKRVGPLQAVLTRNGHARLCLNNVELALGNALLDLLRPIFALTELLSSSTCPTSNLVLCSITSAVTHLRDTQVASLPLEVRIAARLMLGELERLTEKIFEPTSFFMVAAVFDPRLCDLPFAKSTGAKEATYAFLKTVTVKNGKLVRYQPPVAPLPTESVNTQFLSLFRAIPPRAPTSKDQSPLSQYLEENASKPREFADQSIVLQYWHDFSLFKSSNVALQAERDRLCALARYFLVSPCSQTAARGRISLSDSMFNPTDVRMGVGPSLVETYSFLAQNHQEIAALRGSRPDDGLPQLPQTAALATTPATTSTSGALQPAPAVTPSSSAISSDGDHSSLAANTQPDTAPTQHIATSSSVAAPPSTIELSGADFVDLVFPWLAGIWGNRESHWLRFGDRVLWRGLRHFDDNIALQTDAEMESASIPQDSTASIVEDMVSTLELSLDENLGLAPDDPVIPTDDGNPWQVVVTQSEDDDQDATATATPTATATTTSSSVPA